MPSRLRRITTVLLSCGLSAGCGGPRAADPAPPDAPWQDAFALDQCTQATTGRNRFFILEPGHQLVLADKKDQVVITVLDDTVRVNGIETRVIEEREFEGGKLKEVSRNFYTICKEHGDVFYHGEDVDDYKDGKVVGHGGAWRAGVNGARAGLMMPAKTPVGLRHYQEVAPKVAMDRAEVVADAVTLETPAGEFKGCLKVVESTPLEAGTSVKIYAPEVGLVFDDGLVLIARGEGKKPPSAPLPVPAGVGTFLAEVEVPAAEMPPPVAAAVKRLHPDGRIQEVKRESHPGGKTVYAIEVMVGDAQYDVELAPDGTVLLDKKE